MLYRSCQVWGRLKSYLLYSAAGFVALGGLGAAWSARPPVVTDVKAAAFSSSIANTSFSPQLTAVSHWSDRLLNDLNTRALAISQPMSVRERHRREFGHMAANIAHAGEQTTTAASSIWGAQTTVSQPLTAQSQSSVISVGERPITDQAAAVTLTQEAPQRAGGHSTNVEAGLTVTQQDSTSYIPTNAHVPGDHDIHADRPSTTADELANGFSLNDVDSASHWATAVEHRANGFQRTVSVRRGDTLFGVLVDAGMDQGEAQDAVGALADVFSPKALKVGQQITLNFNNVASNESGGNGTKLVALSFEPDVTQDVTLKRSESGDFVAKSIDKPLTQKNIRVAGTIDSSLFGAAQEAGLPIATISDLIKTFSYDVDFQRDIHDGDSFEVFYERYENDEGHFAKAGHTIYASLTLGGKKIPMYYFEHDGDGGYYAPNGESIRKSLIRTPIDGAKITSGFGMRLHPLLGYTRMHKGIDFGAPVGTPIYAAGAGTIVDIGYRDDYGNYIRIRHNSTYSTAYAHSSRFAAGLHKGDHVTQGEVIAYVGATGEATGPHLHYEVLIDNQQVNPATVKITGGDKLTGKDLANFKIQVAKIDAEMAKQRRNTFIAETTGTSVDCRGPSGCEN